MNNNRNNRRRGRGNRSQGGANQFNRIDSRARGNAPQLLDKYKKLAQDAQHNGDRVQAEYYLQFADHYFRVIADNKARQDEARAKRQDDRDPSGDQDQDQNQDEGQDGRRPPRRPRNRRDEADEGVVALEGEPGTEATASLPSEDKKKPARPRTRKPRGANGVRDDGEIDAAALPPSIGGDSGGDEAKPRRRRRGSDDGDALKAAG